MDSTVVPPAPVSRVHLAQPGDNDLNTSQVPAAAVSQGHSYSSPLPTALIFGSWNVHGSIPIALAEYGAAQYLKQLDVVGLFETRTCQTDMLQRACPQFCWVSLEQGSYPGHGLMIGWRHALDIAIIKVKDMAVLLNVGSWGHCLFVVGPSTCSRHL